MNRRGFLSAATKTAAAAAVVTQADLAVADDSNELLRDCAESNYTGIRKCNAEIVISDPVVNGEVWPIDDYLDCRDIVRNGKFPSYAQWIAKRPI